MKGFADNIRELEILLGLSAGNDALMDRFRSGAIHAYKDILDIQFQTTEETQSDD